MNNEVNAVIKMGKFIQNPEKPQFRISLLVIYCIVLMSQLVQQRSYTSEALIKEISFKPGAGRIF